MKVLEVDALRKCPDVELLRRIKLLAMDVDGVLTTGEIVVMDSGTELKAFYAQDGVAIRLAGIAGLKTAWVSARDVPCVRRRGQELGVTHLALGTFEKIPAFEAILDSEGLTYAQAAFIGDDVQDLPLIKRCALGIAVANARDEVKQLADYVTECPGGRGAVREVVELILKAQGLWIEAVAKLVGDPEWHVPTGSSFM
ncbi:MAG TPA: 3-deoxy-D-manno-octulosonate 8-phosphate phosphatase [Armatimonadetes bacterium]|nr:3-deoxy-D-manno-octulosonate 8-phosphate phosphatase [Armatimonadota bacterium]